MAVKAECWTKRKEEEVEEDVAECQQVEDYDKYCHRMVIIIILIKTLKTTRR